MLHHKIRTLRASKDRLAELEREIDAGLAAELGALHLTYGFASIPEFILAVKTAARDSRGSRRGRPAKRGRPRRATKGGKISSSGPGRGARKPAKARSARKPGSSSQAGRRSRASKGAVKRRQPAPTALPPEAFIPTTPITIV